MVTRAVLFDLGNTLVSYYSSAEFPGVLRRCLHECAKTLDLPEDSVRARKTFERALLLNQERADFAVRPLSERLEELFGSISSTDALVAAFMRPIFATARLDPQALLVLDGLRDAGVRTAIVSNTPWGSPAALWRQELRRHGLLDRVDAAVFCMDVGWRKPHRAPFDHALQLLDVTADAAIFVGDDPRWDILGAEGAGIRPVLLDPLAAAAGPHSTIQNLAAVVPLVAGD